MGGGGGRRTVSRWGRGGGMLRRTTRAARMGGGPRFVRALWRWWTHPFPHLLLLFFCILTRGGQWGSIPPRRGGGSTAT